MEAYGVINFFTYIMGVIAVVLLPGPNSMYCLYVASSRGVADGYKVFLGIMTADTLLMLAATLGAATLLKTSPVIFGVFKGLGGLYLMYLGYGLLRGAFTKLRQENADNDSSSINSEENATEATMVKASDNVFLKAFLLGSSNPKAIIFFISFFLQFVDTSFDKPLLSFAILGIALQIISFTYCSLLIFMGTQLVGFFSKRKYLVFFGNAGVGLLFIAFAVSLWMAKV